MSVTYLMGQEMVLFCFLLNLSSGEKLAIYKTKTSEREVEHVELTERWANGRRRWAGDERD